MKDPKTEISCLLFSIVSLAHARGFYDLANALDAIMDQHKLTPSLDDKPLLRVV